MDSDGGLDSTSEHNPCTDNKTSNIEKVLKLFLGTLSPCGKVRLNSQFF